MVIGHQKQLQLLEIAAQSGRMGHAYIFSGPAKIGKKTLALEWLSRITGIELKEGTANPDFMFLSPLIDQKTGLVSSEITVDQIREFIRKISLKSAAGGTKTAIINDAHLMNLESQNCLLKTLEEPPGNSVIVLITQNSQRLLPTIRSRCEILQFNFVSLEQIRDYIKSQTARVGATEDSGDVLTEEITKLSFGRPGRALDFLTNKEEINKWKERETEFAQAIAADLPERFAYVKKLAENEDQNAVIQELEIWQYHFRNLMLEILVPEKIASQALEKDKSKFVFSKAKATSLSLEKVAAILKKIHELTVVLTTTNANTRLALENFMMDI